MRLLLGAVLVVAGAYLAATAARLPLHTVFVPVVVGWVLSTWLTDKYTHKYPRRYYAYLLASHGKAAVVAILTTGLIGLWWGINEGALVAVSLVALISVGDLVLSLPRRRLAEITRSVPTSTSNPTSGPSKIVPPPTVNTEQLRRHLADTAFVKEIPGLSTLIDGFLPESRSGPSAVRVVQDDALESEGPAQPELALLIQYTSLNVIKRLNLFMQRLPGSVAMGGYFVFRYRPMDDYLHNLRSTKTGLGLWATYGWHFLRHRALPKIPVLETLYFSRYLARLDPWVYRYTRENRRVISRAEIWGRAYFWGFEVLGEQKLGDDYWVVTRRFREPETAKKPSFWLVARLTKVGLDGQPMHLHKLRTMYPFSEYVQEKVYKDHGLSNTGKFRNDFRLTDYGKVIRRYWLDEIPQVFDWLRGDVKLVGMRATSPHFLSLYPKELYELYIRTKPGLIPPIFDAATTGFDDIVRIELEYLTAYERAPVTTDVKYLFRTFRDIVFRGVRSK